MASYGVYDSVAHYRLERDVVQNYLVNLFNVSHPGWDFRLQKVSDYWWFWSPRTLEDDEKDALYNLRWE